MRVLVAFVGGSGHLLPTLPVARALAGHGHSVLYTCQERMLSTVHSAGFPGFDSGGPTLAEPAMRRELVPVDRVAEAAVVRESFAGRIAAQRAPRIMRLAERHRVDLVVHDEVDFGASVAARCLALMHVPITVTAAGGFVTRELVGDRLVELCSALGGPTHDAGSLLGGALTVAPMMPSFRDPRHPFPPSTCVIQPDIVSARATGERSAASHRFQQWLSTRSEPLVHLTLGTIFPQESGDLFTRIVDALADVPVSVVVTVGREIDPAELGAVPARVLVEQFLPSHLTIPRSRAVISHGGSGTTIAALALGVPLVLFPMGADQPLNADRCAELGVARVLDPVTATAADISQAVTEVTFGAGCRSQALRFVDEAAALPPADAAVARIEHLVG